MLSLRFKILAVAATLVLLSQAGTVMSVLVTARGDVADRAGRTLVAGANVLRQTTRNRAAQFGNTVIALAADYGFRQAVATRDTATVESALTNHAGRAGSDIALLFDADGRMIAATPGHDPDRPRMSLPEPPIGGNGSHIALIRDGTAYEMFTVPVRAPLPIAWLSMGYALTDDYARQLRDLTGLDVSILATRADGTAVAASSLEDTRRDAMVGLPAAAFSTVPTRARVAGTEHLVIGQRLIDADGSVTVVLSNSLDEAMAPYHLLRNAAVALGAVPLLLALAGAVMLSRTLTQPVRKLVEAAMRIQGGNYEEPVVIDTGDELQEFAIAFNRMQDEIARREERITYQSRHDSVTGLFNRDHAVTVLDDEIERMRGPGRQLAVMVVDLGTLKDIDSTLGHDIADAYLRHATDQLRSLAPPATTLARLETDSFLLILPDAGAEDARDVAERIRLHLERGIGLPDVNITVRPAIGIAVFPLHGDDHDQLLLRATIARSGEHADAHGIGLYRKGAEERRRRRMTLLQEVRGAARRDEFVLHYQPKIAVADEIVCGGEALVRWQHPKFGLLPPDEFIPILEKSGNISILTRWALRRMVRQHRQWRDAGLALDLSVNLSAQDLLDRELPWYVHDLLRDAHMDPRHLVVEITEEAMVRDFAHATAVLRRLREIGIRISIDDFGTGYSSLSQLRDLPVDELKIDKSFVMRLPDDRKSTAIVQAAVDLAHNLGLEFVAEGIETGDAFRWMQRNGVDSVQGYYFSPPLAPEDFYSYLGTFAGGRTIKTRPLQAG